MLFMVPAFAAPGGMTVVVVPLVVLRADMQRRCQQLGILCVAWESRRPPDAASIVLVTPESAVSPDFQTFLNRLRWMRRLDRIVIDECHVVLNSQCDFRPQMAQLGKLVQARTQMVWLTAMLPPSMEDELCRRMKHDQTAVTIYQAQTSRPNVAYRVWRPMLTGVGRGPYQWIESEAVVAFIQDWIRQAAGGKVIIYANIIRQVTTMAWVLGCEAYYSDQLDKARVLDQFMGPSTVIAATSALGMGVDIPNIRSIIHIGTPRTLLDYAQESGRAGRDGQRSEAVII
jgi:superfamily II DNA helicase RecQ